MMSLKCGPCSGVTLQACKSNFNDLILVAIAAHKFVISFCFGMEMANNRAPPLLHTLYIMAFALMTPLGIGIGLAVSEGATQERGYELSTAVLQVILSPLVCQ